MAWLGDHQLPWVAFVTFLQNFWMAQRNSLGSFALTVTWSLAVEEQFYLTLPWIIRVVDPRRLLAVLLVGITLAPALRILLYMLSPKHIFTWFALMPCRADALLLGVLGAMLMRNDGAVAWLRRNSRLFFFAMGVSLAGVLVLLVAAPSTHDRWMLSAGYSWMALFYLLLILAGLLWPESLLGRYLRMRWLRWLGSIAYGLYLCHQLVLGLVFGLIRGRSPVLSSPSDLLLVALTLILSLGVCWVSWTYFERPLIEIGHRAKFEFKGGLSAVQKQVRIKSSIGHPVSPSVASNVLGCSRTDSI
jgi:peptidoglycan/LPS O-acetylase OafA/YrhL